MDSLLLIDNDIARRIQGAVEAGELRGVTAGTVNGQDVRIGPYCRIGNLDCNGTLYVDPKAEVKNLTGNYTQVSE